MIVVGESRVGVRLSVFRVQKSYLSALIGFASQPCVEVSDKDDKKSCHDDRGLVSVLC